MGVTIGAKESKSLPDQPQVTSYTPIQHTSAGQTEAKMKKKTKVKTTLEYKRNQILHHLHCEKKLTTKTFFKD